MTLQRFGLARTVTVALGLAVALSGCALVGPPYGARHSRGMTNARRGVIEQPGGARPRSSSAGAVQAVPSPPGTIPPAAAPQYRLGPAAQALVSAARAQARGGNYGLAAQTLERALSIEPRNPLVWLALGRESLAAGHSAQAYGIARKALYLATGDAAAESSAWGLIAATLRAEGRNQAALVAEHKAALLAMQ